MSDRLPGSSWSNPIRHGEWKIYLNDYVGPGDHIVAWAYVHDDFDGAEDANDNRYGYAATVEACKTQIDDHEDEAAEDAGHITARMAVRAAEVEEQRREADDGF
jgi:hypothetical protein